MSKRAQRSIAAAAAAHRSCCMPESTSSGGSSSLPISSTNSSAVFGSVAVAAPPSPPLAESAGARGAGTVPYTHPTASTNKEVLIPGGAVSLNKNKATK